MSNPGEVTLVAIGPLTNVALAIRQEPQIVKALKEIIRAHMKVGKPMYDEQTAVKALVKQNQLAIIQ